MSHVTHMNESCHTYEWVMSHIWMSCVTHMNELCHRYEWGMSHTYEWVMSHTCHASRAWSQRWILVSEKKTYDMTKETYDMTKQTYDKSHLRCVEPKANPCIRYSRMAWSKQRLSVGNFIRLKNLSMSIRCVSLSFSLSLLLPPKNGDTALLSNHCLWILYGWRI